MKIKIITSDPRGPAVKMRVTEVRETKNARQDPLRKQGVFFYRAPDRAPGGLVATWSPSTPCGPMRTGWKWDTWGPLVYITRVLCDKKVL
jgi:hypothetical protein